MLIGIFNWTATVSRIAASCLVTLTKLIIHLQAFGLVATLRAAVRAHSRNQDYAAWMRRSDTLTARDCAAIARHIRLLPHRPTISVVSIITGAGAPFLRDAIHSVANQIYPDWELFLFVDDAAITETERATIAHARSDFRFNVNWARDAVNCVDLTNRALDFATGDFVTFLDPNDLMAFHALYLVAVEITRHPDADIIYSDEDTIDALGRRKTPHFKPDWSPDLMCGQNIVGQLAVFRRSLLAAVGGLRHGFGGAEDYDLVLRVVDETVPAKIRHIPRILYHKRADAEPTSLDVGARPGLRLALAEHIARRGMSATIESVPNSEFGLRLRYRVPRPVPLVSLVVPTRDRIELLRACVTGLLNRTSYGSLEVLIVDNDSTEPATLAYLAAVVGDPRVRVLHYPGSFNYSSLNNYAVTQASGDIIGLVNNDIVPIASDWLDEMVGHALRPDVGAVGAKLYYGDDTIQHAGIVTGMGGIASHVGKGLPRTHPGQLNRLQLVHNVSCVTGACLLVRKAVYQELEGLDAVNLPVAYNDVDFCLRLRERGYLIVWTPFAELYHLESATRGTDNEPAKVRRFVDEIRYMRQRWGETLMADPYYNPNLSLDDVKFGLAFPPRAEKPWRTKEG